ncbi:MAG: SDR family oxidoreductase [Verrucomicrobiales bacterium]|nr:SDR family oxidoreductase [Verrucomicrobiales bacterium]
MSIHDQASGLRQRATAAPMPGRPRRRDERMDEHCAEHCALRMSFRAGKFRGCQADWGGGGLEAAAWLAGDWVFSMKITVTGARGFLGNAVACELTSRGHEVCRLARPDWDMLAVGAWEAVPESVEILIHTAAAFGGTAPEEQLWRTNVACLMGLVRRSLELQRLRHIVFCSSGAVYAPQREPVSLATPVRPTTVYGMTKLLGETMLRQGCEAPVTCVRLFFPFGPGQGPGRLIPRLVQSIRRGEKVILQDSGGGPRFNPLPVDRAVACLVRAAEAGGEENRIINLGGPVALDMRELAGRIGGVVGRVPDFHIPGSSPTRSLHCEVTKDSGTNEEFENTLVAAISAVS